MTVTGWVAAGALVAAAVAVATPSRAARARWRLLLRPPAPARSATGGQRHDPVGASVVDDALSEALPGPFALARRRLDDLRIRSMRQRRATVALGGVAAAMLGSVAGGPVAGVVLGAYGACGAIAAMRRSQHRAEARSLRAAVDAVVGLAAELRAGIPASVALVTAAPMLEGPAVLGADATSVGRRVAAATQLAESTGAPLADVLDRLDAHLRAVDRARGTAAAQAAGARASAGLLAAMPLGGVGLGFLVDTDPLHVLLHTPLGAGCLVGAVGLQLAGLAWSVRLSRLEVAA